MKKLILSLVLLGSMYMGYGQSVLIEPNSNTSESQGSVDNYLLKGNSNLTGINGIRYNGTLGSKTAVVNDNTLLNLTSGGYYNPANFLYDAATIKLKSAQNWTSTATGSKIVFSTTLNNTTSRLERMVIDHNGNVGLGVATAQTNLQIHQPTAATGSFLQLSNADVGFGASNGLKIGINPNTLVISKNATIINQENSFLSLGTNNQFLMNFTADQKIGIGAANIAPVGVVDIHHTGTDAAPHFNLRTLNDGAPNFMRFENSNGTRSFIHSYYLGSATAANNYFDLRYGTDILTTITGDGKFGINNLTPADLLHLSPISNTGDVYARISSNSGGLSGIRLQNQGGDWSMYTNEFNNMFIGYSTNNFTSTTPVLNLFPNLTNFELKPAVNNQVFLGTSANRWIEIYSVNPLNTSSDRRLKKNINEIKYGLKEVLKLSAVSYNWKSKEDTKLHLGFIAQDVAEIVPEIVTKSGITDAEFEKQQKEGKTVTDTYGMEYTSLIPVLVKAIQEQQEIIDAKSIKISKLEEKLKTLDNLEARLSQLESNAVNNKTALLKSDK